VLVKVLQLLLCALAACALDHVLQQLLLHLQARHTQLGHTYMSDNSPSQSPCVMSEQSAWPVTMCSPAGRCCLNGGQRGDGMGSLQLQLLNE
jgi:hypothetical protein